MAEPEPEGDVEVPPFASLEGLAEAWEQDFDIRHNARQRGSLLNWGGAASVGVATMLLCMSANSILCSVYL